MNPPTLTKPHNIDTPNWELLESAVKNAGLPPEVNDELRKGTDMTQDELKRQAAADVAAAMRIQSDFFQGLTRIFDPAPSTVACKHCGKPTPMLGTKLCDNCWETKKRLFGLPAPQIAGILYVIDQGVDTDENYLGIGSPATDYGDEWPDAARAKAQQYTACAAFLRRFERNDCDALAGRCQRLADRLEESAAGYKPTTGYSAADAADDKLNMEREG